MRTIAAAVGLGIILGASPGAWAAEEEAVETLPTIRVEDMQPVAASSPMSPASTLLPVAPSAG